MANYFTIDYEDTTPSVSGTVELNYGYAYSSGRIVNVSMFAGSGFTPTHYKLWGLELVEGEEVVTSGTATWQIVPETGQTTAYLNAGLTTPQYVSVKFKDSGDGETEVFTSNGVSFNFVAPTLHGSGQWKNAFSGVNYESISSNTIENSEFATEVAFSKANIEQLKFSGRSFYGLKIEPDTIYISPTSQIGKLISATTDNHVVISKVFSSEDPRLVTVADSGGFRTLTTYSGTLKSSLSLADSQRIDNVSWDTDTISFNAYEFSTYGFTTVSTVAFTTDSESSGYTGNTMTFRVVVKDSNGEAVELAPVTISGSGDSVGTIQEAMPVNTNVSGIAEFTIPITTEGIAYFSASVDDLYFSSNDHSIFALDMPTTQRSLLTQLEQIFKTETYDDAIAGVNTEAVAEPSGATASGSSDSVLEHDLNVFRTLLRQVKTGTVSGTNWYDSLGYSFDPTNTDISNTETKTFDLTAVKNSTLDSKTIIVAADDSNSDLGYSVSTGSEGFLSNITTRYATADNRVGLPIYNSTTNSGSYFDEGGIDDVVVIDLLNMASASEFKDSLGNTIYGKFHDAADHSGTGTGTDVYVKFYTSEGPYTTTSGDPTSLMMVYPVRKVLGDMEEYEWLRTTFVSSWEGDAALVEDLIDLWSYTGASNDTTVPNWTTVSGTPIVDSSILSLKAAIDAINYEVGDRTWTELSGYLINGQTITDSLDALDQQLYSLAQSAAAGVAEVYVEVTASGITHGVAHDTPIAYTPESTSGREGKNMDVFFNGQLLTPSTGINGINSDRDYAETSTTQITFHFDIDVGSNITYKVRQ